MAKERTNDELVSDLPSFAAKRSTDFASWLIVTCPREECGEIFLVRASTWLRPHQYKSKDRSVLITGRACPYCFKAGRLPTRAAIK